MDTEFWRQFWGTNLDIWPFCTRWYGIIHQLTAWIQRPVWINTDAYEQLVSFSDKRIKLSSTYEYIVSAMI